MTKSFGNLLYMYIGGTQRTFAPESNSQDRIKCTGSEPFQPQNSIVQYIHIQCSADRYLYTHPRWLQDVRLKIRVVGRSISPHQDRQAGAKYVKMVPSHPNSNWSWELRIVQGVHELFPILHMPTYLFHIQPKSHTTSGGSNPIPGGAIVPIKIRILCNHPWEFPRSRSRPMPVPSRECRAYKDRKEKKTRDKHMKGERPSVTQPLYRGDN